MAMISAGEVASERLLELVRDAELDDLSAVSAQMSRLTEASMRAAIGRIPDGTYRSELELDGTDTEAIKVKIAVLVAGETLTIDFGGSSPQVSKGMNCPFNYTEAYTFYPIKCVLDPGPPRNEGSYRSVRVTAPEGSILNPRFPSAVNARHLVGHSLAGAVYQALAQVIPDRVIAESGSAPTMRAVISGWRDDETRFSTIPFINGGMGAGATHDGLAATCFPSNVISAHEMIESLAPLRSGRRSSPRTRADPGSSAAVSGRKSRSRSWAQRDCTVSFFVERRTHPARGVAGGLPGSPSVVEWNGRRAGYSLKGRSTIKPGDRLLLRYPGGGGHGDPRKRSRDALERDVASGFVTPAEAEQAYGIDR